MKSLIKILVAILCVGCIYLCGFWLKTTKSELYIKTEIDSLKKEISLLREGQAEIKSKVDSVRANTDTLKKGQAVIFEQVKRTADKTFWDFFR